MSRTIALMLALAVVTAGVLAAGSSGARQTQRTIGLITRYGADGFFVPVESGARSAAAALGDHLNVTEAGSWGDGWAQISAIKSLIARHAAAIAFATDEPAALKQVLPALVQARAAGIPTVSFQLPSPGSVWANQSSPAQFAQALADALTSQLQQTGQFVIVSCRPAESIVGTELKLTKAYIQRRYPQMQRVGVAYGDLGNGTVDTDLFNRLMLAHPQLRGLIFLCPGEAYNQPPLLVQAHEVGKVFTAGNGGACPPLDDPYLTSVRLGAEEIVCPGDPAKLGYLTVWAANYLARGHTLTPGSVRVGGPVGTVQYFSHNQELRLGPPLTITKANLAQYAGKPCPPGTPYPC
jgi:ABC-type sugar transport system substrate-binding protein